MKTPIMAMVLLVAVSSIASAQEVETKRTNKKKLSPTLERQAAPNEVVRNNVSYDGVAVQCTKANPLQLINPFAPAEYGEAEQNVSRDPVDNKVRGLKIFNVRF